MKIFECLDCNEQFDEDSSAWFEGHAVCPFCGSQDFERVDDGFDPDEAPF